MSEHVRRFRRLLSVATARLIKPLVIAVLAAVCWTLLAGYAVLWGASPLTASLLLSHATAFGMGLWWRDRRREALAVVSDWHDEEIDAIKLADTQTDKRVISGEHPVVAPYDQDRPCPVGWHYGDALPCNCEPLDDTSLPRTVPPTYDRRIQ